MKTGRTDSVLLGISMGSFLVLAVSFLLMPLESLRIVPGAMFWGGLVTGISTQIILEVRRRRFFTFYAVPRKKMQKPRNGLLTFGSNREAVIADHCLLLCAVVTLPVLLITKGYGYICFICICATLYAFCMHCIFNGRIYFHIKNNKKIRQVLEQRKANFKDKGEGEI